MNIVKAITDLRRDVSWLRKRVNKLPSRISNSAGGGGGGGGTGRPMIPVETYADLPPADSVQRTKFYLVLSGTYANGIAHAYDDGVNPPVWRFVNYWQ